jgi:rRNA-processing protein FCF1
MQNAVSGSYRELVARDQYVQAIEEAERHMRTWFVSDDWLERLHTERYWKICELREDSPRPFPLISQEVERQAAWLDEVIVELEAIAAEDDAADLGATRAIVDTNVHLHFRPFDEVNWPAQLGVKSVRLLVPIAVLRELDEHKNRGRDPIGHRAGARLAAMHRSLEGHGRGPAFVRQGVTVEIVLNPHGHVRHPNNDEEILDCAEVLAPRRGGPLVLVTGDLSMRLRAEARGLTVAVLPDSLRLDHR